MTDAQTREITNKLKEILCFVGADVKYAAYAQLHDSMEWFYKNMKELEDS